MKEQIWRYLVRGTAPDLVGDGMRHSPNAFPQFYQKDGTVEEL